MLCGLLLLYLSACENVRSSLGIPQLWVNMQCSHPFSQWMWKGPFRHRNDVLVLWVIFYESVRKKNGLKWVFCSFEGQTAQMHLWNTIYWVAIYLETFCNNTNLIHSQLNQSWPKYEYLVSMWTAVSSMLIAIAIANNFTSGYWRRCNPHVSWHNNQSVIPLTL